jgi:hypothetical protein
MNFSIKKPFTNKEIPNYHKKYYLKEKSSSKPLPKK